MKFRESIPGRISMVRLNPVLQHILKNRFGKEIQLSECQEEAACGAAISACGDIKTDL